MVRIARPLLASIFIYGGIDAFRNPESKAPKAGPAKSLAEKLLACLDIDDESKERLDCYDAAIPPNTKPKSAKAGAANATQAARAVRKCTWLIPLLILRT